MFPRSLLRSNVRYQERNHLSGGTLKVPQTPAQRTIQIVKQRRLRADYYRRHDALL